MPPKRTEHLFIISTGSPRKPDANSAYQRRAHAARIARRRALEKSKKQTPACQQPPTNFHDLKPIQAHPELLQALTHLTSFTNLNLNNPTNSRPTGTRSQSKPGTQAEHTLYKSLLEARTLLQTMPAHTNGLAFLPAKDLIYEATRYSTMIYINMIVADPLIRAKLVSVTSDPTLPETTVTDILHGHPLQRQPYQTLEIKAYFNTSDPDHTRDVPTRRIPRHPSYALRYVLNSLFKDICWREHFGVMAWAVFLGAVGSLPSSSSSSATSSSTTTATITATTNATEEEQWRLDNEERRRADLQWFLSQLRERVVRDHDVRDWDSLRALLMRWLWCGARIGEDVGQRVWLMLFQLGDDDSPTREAEDDGTTGREHPDEFK